MAFIETVGEEEATGELAALYRRYGRPDEGVDNVLKVHGLNPESLAAHIGLYVQALHGPSPLSRAEREMAGVVVSRLNGCAYCLRHHAAGLKRLLAKEGRGEVADRVARGDASGLSAREAAMLWWVEKATAAPAEMTRADAEALRSAGLSDRAILDLAQVTGYFAYVNRMVLALGVAIEEEDALGYSPSDTGAAP